jgi:hypothetical protein
MILGKPWLRAVKAKADHCTEKYTIFSAEGRVHELIKNGPTWESAPTIFRDAKSNYSQSIMWSRTEEKDIKWLEMCQLDNDIVL